MSDKLLSDALKAIEKYRANDILQERKITMLQQMYSASLDYSLVQEKRCQALEDRIKALEKS